MCLLLEVVSRVNKACLELLLVSLQHLLTVQQYLLEGGPLPIETVQHLQDLGGKEGGMTHMQEVYPLQGWAPRVSPMLGDILPTSHSPSSLSVSYIFCPSKPAFINSPCMTDPEETNLKLLGLTEVYKLKGTIV